MKLDLKNLRIKNTYPCCITTTTGMLVHQMIYEMNRLEARGWGGLRDVEQFWMVQHISKTCASSIALPCIDDN